MPADVTTSGVITREDLAEGRRFYSLDGKLVGASVTTVIDGALGHDGIPKAVWEHAGRRGTAVHEAIHLYEGGVEGHTLDLDSLHEEVRPHFEGYLHFKADYPSIKFTLSEHFVVSLKYHYGGALDAVYWDGDETLVDWKSGMELGRHASQLAAYKNALDEMGYPNAKKLRRKCVYLTKERTYRVVEHSGEGDFYDFLAMQRLYQTKEHHSGKY